MKTQILFKYFFYLLVIISLCGCVNKKTTENDKTAESGNNPVNNTTIGEDINNPELPVEEKVYVVSFDGLYLRSNYGITGTIIMLLPHNTELTVLERSEEKETIDNINDYWYKVDTGKETGWVFGGYLFHKPVNEKIKNIEIAKMVAEVGRFWNGGNIMSLREAIEYHNNDTIIIYDETSKESEYFFTDRKNIFLIKLEETPGWLYAVSYDYEIQGYVYIYDISEKSYYGNLEYDGTMKIEYQILRQHQNIKRYGPLLLINYNKKNIEFLDTYDGRGGRMLSLIDYYPEYNEIIMHEQYYEGSCYFIYNLEHEEVMCERINKPKFNNARTYLISQGYEYGGVDLHLQLFKTNNDFYEEIYNGFLYIDGNMSPKDISWINDHEARMDFGEAGNVLIEIGNEVKIVNNLVPVSSNN